MSVLYDRIHSLCDLKGVKDGTMCREANVPRSTFQELKMGRTENLSLKTLQKIADYFGVSVSELTGEEQKEKPNTLDGIELDLSSLSAEDVELFKRIIAAPEAKKNAIRELL